MTRAQCSRSGGKIDLRKERSRKQDGKIWSTLYFSQGPFSPALCRGLIEAAPLRQDGPGHAEFSPALCRGLIEASCACDRPTWRPCSPRRYAGASLKHRGHGGGVRRSQRSPRRYAGASLKLEVVRALPLQLMRFSPALCRGLIEAFSRASRWSITCGFSPSLCRGLIEAGNGLENVKCHQKVLPGVMPGPH